ncbi:glycosyl hydrolase [Pedobacter sp. HMWF019]|nr:glycosyl hydrolase [Pedobacter sp. HMWF019]
MNRHLLLVLFMICSYQYSFAIDDKTYISSQASKAHFPLSQNGSPTSIFVNPQDYPGVLLAAKNLQSDLKLVTGNTPYFYNVMPKKGMLVIIGTLGKSPEIDLLVKQHKLEISAIKGKWETFVIQTVKKPFPGIDEALVITGSDKRGTIYGIYDLSSKIGVSPWYWWADVPVKQQKNLFVAPGLHSQGTPAVKYRGIFLNDEAPALSGWSKEKFGGFNHKFYTHVFELILRLKGNYLWPAMWGNAFYDDDPLNPKLADEYGIVIGTSHHEPLTRAHDEWRRYGKGPWNYATNEQALKEFWTKGIQRMGNNESIVTVGMRGDGDEPMSEGSNIALLERIVKDQRQIIAEQTKKEASKTPQLWALYKEVQDYYDKGMRVPDDITLLLCDDNWGNIRKLPKLSDRPRSGGYGVYYHFDYVGGPRNYKWLNTNPLPRIWEQMNLAYEYGANQIWIVNVGDLKPMEFPIEFFLDYAWSPKRWPVDHLEAYTALWVEKQFGKNNATAIASVLSRYGKYSSRRKPELLDANTYSLTNYREFERVVEEYQVLLADAEELNKKIPADAKDAYDQLILFPVRALANLNEMYYAAAKNNLYAIQGRAATNAIAITVKERFDQDAALTKHYNTEINHGKWNHMMDQTHIGYTGWQQPEVNAVPATQTIPLPEKADMGVAIEGSANWWPHTQSEAILPGIYKQGNSSAYIEIFNRGKIPFHYKIMPEKPWIKLSQTEGEVNDQVRISLTADFSKIPDGSFKVPILIQSDQGNSVTVYAEVHQINTPKQANTFQEQNGYISIEAANYTRNIETNALSWKVLPDHGRTSSAVAPFPVTAKTEKLAPQSPRLEYAIELQQAGEVKINAYLSPTLDFSHDMALSYAISMDDETPQTIDIIKADQRNWDTNVAENIKILSSKHEVKKPGVHTLKVWALSPGVVLQKLVLETKAIPASYLGPPESPR